RDADTMLGELLAYLKASGLDKTTDVFVTADHGFATSTHSAPGSTVDLPSGFLAADLAKVLGLKLNGSSMLGSDPAHPDVVVAANGGSDLIYLPAMNDKNPAPAKKMAGEIVKFLAGQDYASGIFVNDRLGKFPGALSMSDVGLMGAARTPQPAMYVNFRSFSSGCENELQCTVAVMDTPLATGQGNHGSFSRAETRNFMAAIGPDFKTGYADLAPISNADIAPTLAHVMGLEIPARGTLKGRVITEALVGGAEVQVQRQTVKSAAGPDGVQTILNLETAGPARYFDAAGFAGKT